MSTNENPALAGGVSELDHVATLIASEDTSTNAPAQAYAFHPLADIFPLMEGEDFAALVADIKANGQIEDIVLFDGMILDGRNRYRACMAAGVPPTMYEADKWIADPAAFVISVNIRRRHLTHEQKRELIIKIIASAPEKSDRQIAKSVGVDHKTIGAARAKGEQLGSIPQLKKTMGADGKARKRPQSRTERRQVRLDRAIGRSETKEATAAAAASPLIATWDTAPRAERHAFIVARKRELLRIGQLSFDTFTHMMQELLKDAPETWHKWVRAYAEAELNRRGGNATSAPADTSEPKRRGRLPGSKNKPKPIAVDVDKPIETIAPTTDDDFSDTLASRMRQGESTGAPDEALDDIPPFLDRTGGAS